MEEKKNKRGWVKTAAIVFLSVLLVLTFFSNTIMNATLPEVAIRTVTSGSINVQIRGTGTVKATETYNVTVDESRKVRSVNVKLGDEVSVGDLIMVLSDESSEELVNAEAELKEAKRVYYETVNFDTSIREATRDLNDAKENLAKAEKLLANVADYDAAVAEAEARLKAAEEAVKSAQTEINTINSQLSALSKELKKYDSSLVDKEVNEESLEILKNIMATDSENVKGALIKLEIATDNYKSRYDEIVKEATDIIKRTSGYKALSDKAAQQQYLDERLQYYVEEEYAKIKNGTSELVLKWNNTTGEWYTDADSELQSLYEEAYEGYTEAVSNYNKAVENYKLSQGTEIPDFIAKCEATLKTLELATEDKENKEKEKNDAETALSELKDLDPSALTKLKRDVTDAQTNYNKTSYEYSNKLNDQKALVEKLEAEVAKYSGVQTGTEIHSEINGVIKQINVSAGAKTTPDSTLVAIEVPDRGYTAEMSVTVDQAQRVVIGDKAEVQSGWWWGGRDITARLVAIRTDPQTARTNRILVFDISGSDVNSGDTLNLTIGERSRSFDTIVPKSAMRSDSNGDFVLMVVARQSPMGNRYTAQRIDVTKLAEDDVNVAVSGDLSYNDAVITTTTAPISSGMQVRMAGN
ncbi:MAG: HlyD family efflux transporter periplasmic adaptor subunit [Oscillospiraceae bacterium]|nr:HlyD family efflux transporter periplasmic adaptor subunit [Oscillospiraceae bacterium]